MTADLDMERVMGFRRTLADNMNAAATVLMMSIGHQTGLFDTMARLEPSTPTEIADAAGLHERYVREWLGSMASAGVVEYHGTADTFSLPAEHAVLTTRASGIANMATYMQFIPLLGQVEEQIIDKFRNGGGVPYPEYAGFHRVMADVSRARFDAVLVDHVVPLVPGLAAALERGIDLADVGCGSGHAVNVLAQTFPHSTFVGYDFSPEAIANATAEAEALGLTNATFEERDAVTLDESRQFDFITTFDAVHDQAHPREMVAAVYRALKPGGFWLCADICASSHVGENLDHPSAPFFYAVSCMHCMSVSLAYDGEGLGAMWGVQLARRIFAEAGFDRIVVETIDADPSNNYYVCHKRA